MDNVDYFLYLFEFQIYLKIMEDFRIAMNSFTFGTLKALFGNYFCYSVSCMYI